MLTVLHFLELRLFFSNRELRTPFPVTVDKLTGVWYCTPRYAKLIIRKLCELGWIEWQAGRGRGHTSVLTFLIDSDDLLLEEVKNRMEQGEVNEAMELMNRFGGTAVKTRFMDWLSEGMGFSTRSVSDKVVETLRFPVYRTIITLDPGLVYYNFDAHIAGQLFNTLVAYDDESRTVVPCIAHSWETSVDGREWMFHLKKSVLFHHGRELTAHDVVFSLDRIRLHPDRFQSSWMFQDIELVEAIDHKTVRIRLHQPNYLFLRLLSTIPASIVPEEIVRRDEVEFGKKPVGTGPFQLMRLNEGICILQAFPTHFQGRPQLDRVEVIILPEMEAGRLKEPDWTSVMTSHGDASKDQREALESNDEWCNMQTLFSCCSLLVCNQQARGPQNHPAFRQALSHIIDREQMIAELGGDRLYPAYSFRPYPEDVHKSTGGDTRVNRSEIEQLLNASGYRGEPFRMVTTAHHQEDAEWIRERCEAFGIQMIIDVRDPSEFAVHDSLPEHDCLLFGNVFHNDEVCELKMYLQKNYFLSAYDEQTAEVVKKTAVSIFRESDEKERQHKLAYLEDVMRQTYSVLYLVQKKTDILFHKSVRGVRINSFGWLDFDKIWFQPQES